ncbi:MAG: SDR family oxidoreductase [Candidatus Dormibacteraeota bacterium]|nr:SDR family oxidoreductase [Candidatus Dormibacteraeota bacterium]
MDLKLRGRRALVTAASRGLGRACAEALAREGAQVFIVARGLEALAKTADEVGAVGRQALDLSDPSAPTRAVAAAVDTLGGLDILVANAGGPPPGTFTSTPPDAWDVGFQLTLQSTVRLLRESLPHLRDSPQPRVVIVTSASVREPIPNLVLSNAFRSAVTATAKTLSREVAPTGVTINCLAPGRFATDRVRELDDANAKLVGKTRADLEAESVAAIPAGRYGQPAEFGAVCAFLCSHQAGYLTGQTIVLDGGALHATV